MKKLRIYLLLFICCFYACKEKPNSNDPKNLNLKGETWTLQNLDSNETWTLYFYSDSEFKLDWPGETVPYLCTYSYDGNKLISDYFEIFCIKKTNKKSSLDGTEWVLNPGPIYIKLNKETHSWQCGDYSGRGIYSYDGKTLSFSGVGGDGPDPYRIKFSCGSILYDLAKE